MTASATVEEFLAALKPVAKALGAAIVPSTRLHSGDIPLVWKGEAVAGFRLPDLQGALARLISQVEREMGGRLGELSREAKQRAVRLLEERGAFTLRRSIEDVADAMGVSRITVYNYLSAISRGD